MAKPQHPLLQPVVINNLLEYVPKSAWRTTRLVCKPWKDELLPRWRKVMNVWVGQTEKNGLATKVDPNKPFLNIPSFLSTHQPDAFLQLEKVPFKYVVTIPGQLAIGGENGVDTTFWTICGAWLHRIHFYGVMFNDGEMLKSIIFRLTPNLKELEFTGCDVPMMSEAEQNDPTAVASYSPGNVVQPNLKILKVSLMIRGSGMWIHRSYGTFPLSFLNMLSVFTQIEEMCLKEFRIEHKFIDYLLHVFGTIREKNQNTVLNIKKLDLKSLELKFSPELVTKLNGLSLPLEELQFDIKHPVDDGQLLSSKFPVLNKLFLFNNLKHYTLGNWNHSQFQYKALPPMLTQLYLEGYVFTEWNFLASTPNLIILHVVENCGDQLNPIQSTPNKIFTLESLTTFHYKAGGVEVARDATVDIFTKIMPNVKKLFLSVGCTGFGKVCDAWPLLTSWEIPIANMSQSTFITNTTKLKNLTYFKVGFFNDDPRFGVEIMNQFRNPSIQYGFLRMPKLQKLCISFPSGLSKNLLQNLYEKVEDTEEVFYLKTMSEGKYRLKTITGNLPVQPHDIVKPLRPFRLVMNW